MSEDRLRTHLLRPMESSKEDGLGLGVYTIRQVVRLHGGRLRIASSPAGTRLQFSFPVSGE
jgi:nitrogen-specific signal transduction histidine kinase